MTISNEAVEAAKKAMQEVTPPPGVTKDEWFALHGNWALIAGAIAAAAPFIRAEALEDAADGWSDWDALQAPEDWLRNRAAAVRGEG